MNTRLTLFNHCFNHPKETLWYPLKRYVIHPAAWIGGMSQNGGLTGFGLLKFFHFYFGKNKDLDDPDVLIAALYFMSCTFGIIYITRMPGLREFILDEQYKQENKDDINIKTVAKDLVTFLRKCGNNNETFRHRLGDGTTLFLQILNILSTGLNLSNMLLNTSTLYNYVYQLAYHDEKPNNITGEMIYSITTALTANIIYFTFNIKGALKGSKKVGDWIKGNFNLYNNHDEFKVFVKAALLLFLQAGCAPFFAYLQSHNSLKQLPFGMGEGISESFNHRFSMFSAGLFVLSRTLATGSSVFKFWNDLAGLTVLDPDKPPPPPPTLREKIITYFLGFGDCLGTTIGNMVAYFFLVHEFFGSKLHDSKEHPFEFDHFKEEFPTWKWHLFAASLVGILNGAINFMFSVKNGLERAVEIESRIDRNKYKPLFFCCQGNRRLLSGTIQENKTDNDPVVSSYMSLGDSKDLTVSLLPKMNGNGIRHAIDINDTEEQPSSEYVPPVQSETEEEFNPPEVRSEAQPRNMV